MIPRQSLAMSGNNNNNNHIHHTPHILPQAHMGAGHSMCLLHIAAFTEPGCIESGCALTLLNESRSHMIHQDAFIINQFHADSLQPEYDAMFEGLVQALDRGILNLHVVTSLEIICQQLNMNYQELTKLTEDGVIDSFALKIRRLMLEFRFVDIELVPPEIIRIELQLSREKYFQYRNNGSGMISGHYQPSLVSNPISIGGHKTTSNLLPKVAQISPTINQRKQMVGSFDATTTSVIGNQSSHQHGGPIGPIAGSRGSILTIDTSAAPLSFTQRNPLLPPPPPHHHYYGVSPKNNNGLGLKLDLHSPATPSVMSPVQSRQQSSVSTLHQSNESFGMYEHSNSGFISPLSSSMHNISLISSEVRDDYNTTGQDGNRGVDNYNFNYYPTSTQVSPDRRVALDDSPCKTLFSEGSSTSKSNRMNGFGKGVFSLLDGLETTTTTTTSSTDTSNTVTYPDNDMMSRSRTFSIGGNVFNKDGLNSSMDLGNSSNNSFGNSNSFFGSNSIGFSLDAANKSVDYGFGSTNGFVDSSFNSTGGDKIGLTTLSSTFHSSLNHYF